MVDDDSTDELIRWSNNGDSFYIPSEERLRKELLPRFFKHSNFSSFNRQLNMYGFHKLPRIHQQPSASSHVSCEFQNCTNFLRHRPDLLVLVQRKKASPTAAPPAPSITEPTTSIVFASSGDDEGSFPPALSYFDLQPSSSSTPSTSLAQNRDYQAIITGLDNIRAQQTSVSQELSDLRVRNHQLWTEVLVSHERQQETTDRVLRFLADMFGDGVVPLVTGGDGSGRSGDLSEEGQGGGLVASPSRPQDRIGTIETPPLEGWATVAIDWTSPASSAPTSILPLSAGPTPPPYRSPASSYSTSWSSSTLLSPRDDLFNTLPSLSSAHSTPGTSAGLTPRSFIHEDPSVLLLDPSFVAKDRSTDLFPLPQPSLAPNPYGPTAGLEAHFDTLQDSIFDLDETFGLDAPSSDQLHYGDVDATTGAHFNAWPVPHSSGDELDLDSLLGDLYGSEAAEDEGFGLSMTGLSSSAATPDSGGGGVPRGVGRRLRDDGLTIGSLPNGLE